MVQRVDQREDTAQGHKTVRGFEADKAAPRSGNADRPPVSVPALLVLGCPTIAASPDKPALTPLVSLRVPKSSVSFDILESKLKRG